MKDGVPQRSDDRLFFQLLVFTGCADAAAVASHIRQSGVEGAVYENVNDPRGVAILSLTRTPEAFVERVRPLLLAGPCADLTLMPELTRCSDGRIHSATNRISRRRSSTGRGATVLNPAWRWAIWYPLRRSGRFAQLPEQEQRTILAEHGAIGMSFGAGDYAHDVRLACHGLDRDDNDFVIGLIGKDLFPALGRRPGDAQDAADGALPRPSRAVLRRPRHLAIRIRRSTSCLKRSRMAVPLRPFGKHTDVSVSALGLGGYHLGEREIGRDATRIVHAAIDAGVTFLDNAWEYHEHESEVRMGRAIAGPARAGLPDDQGLHPRARCAGGDAAARGIAPAAQDRPPRSLAGPRVRLLQRSRPAFRARRRHRSARSREARRQGAVRRLHRAQGPRDPPAHAVVRLSVRRLPDAAERVRRVVPQLRAAGAARAPPPAHRARSA